MSHKVNVYRKSSVACYLLVLFPRARFSSGNATIDTYTRWQAKKELMITLLLAAVALAGAAGGARVAAVSAAAVVVRAAVVVLVVVRTVRVGVCVGKIPEK